MAEAKYAAGEFTYPSNYLEAKWRRQSKGPPFVLTNQKKISLVYSFLISISRSSKMQRTR